MQIRHIGGISDFGKFALLRHPMNDRTLAVCCYLTGGNEQTKDRERHFDYLKTSAPVSNGHLHRFAEYPSWRCRIVSAASTPC